MWNNSGSLSKVGEVLPPVGGEGKGKMLYHVRRSLARLFSEQPAAITTGPVTTLITKFEQLLIYSRDEYGRITSECR